MKKLSEGYLITLKPHNRLTYEKKIKECFDIDPYELKLSDCDKDWDLFPYIAHGDIHQYLVCATNSITLVQMKAYKSLESHNYFTSGWVNPTIYHKVFQQKKHLLLGEVNHSQSLRQKTLKVWILAMHDGEIITANCTCMAGLEGSCSHVGALLFAVETGIRLHLQSCTSQANKWLPAHVKNAPLVKIKDLDFASAKRKKKNLDTNKDPNDTATTPLQNAATELSSDQLQKFLQKIKESGSNSAILKVVDPFYKEYSTEVPASVMDKYFNDSTLNMKWHELFAHCQNIFHKELSISKVDADFIEKVTKGQSKNKAWYYQRAGRITASVMKRVQTSNVENPSWELITDVCYPDSKAQISNKAIMWGRNHEWKAVNDYKKQQISLHDGLNVESCGIFVNHEFPFIGASPDAIVSCSCCGIGVCEVKCPYTIRDSVLGEIQPLDIPYLEYDDSHNLCVKKSHNYYHQIQTQIFVCNVNYGDFIIWTKKDLFVERILPDYQYWETAFEKASSFFVRCILPEVCSKWYTRQRELKDQEKGSQPVL